MTYGEGDNDPEAGGVEDFFAATPPPNDEADANEDDGVSALIPPPSPNECVKDATNQEGQISEELTDAVQPGENDEKIETEPLDQQDPQRLNDVSVEVYGYRDDVTGGESERLSSRRGSYKATSKRQIPSLTEAEVEAYTQEVAVERTASGFYGEDGYYYYYVYEDAAQDEGGPETAGVETSEDQGINSEVPLKRRATTNKKFVVGMGSGKLNGYLSLPASHPAQEAEAALARIRNWVTIDTIEEPFNEAIGLGPDDAGTELRSTSIVDSVKAKAIIQYLRSDPDRWAFPPLDTDNGALVAGLRVPSFAELRQRLKYEDLDVGATLQSQSSLSHEWTRIQNEVQISMASQAERARRASVTQRRHEARQSQQVSLELHGRRLSNLLFLIPPREGS